MDKQIIPFIVCEVIMVICAFCLKIVVFKIANKAITEKKLSTGIYRLYPIEGEQAVKLAKGYISGTRIAFSFFIFFIPLVFILSVLNGTIKL